MPEHNEIDCGFDVQQRQQQHAALAINIYPISYFQDSVVGIIFTDPDTKSWLEQNSNPVFGFPSVVRFSWATCKPYFTKGGVDIFWDGSDDDEETERRKSKIVETESCAPLRHSFFRSRQLQQVTTRL
jgi:hypothetical protein